MVQVGGPYNRLPEELKQTPNWCIAGPDKAPYGVGADGALVRISVHDYHKFMEFAQAVNIASYYPGAGIGFILTPNDPFTCIDIDFKDARNEPNPAKHTTPDQVQRFNHIIGVFDTYTEVSRGGLGVHIWCKGGRGAGVRRDGIEVYSKERFIVCTGNVMNDRPLVDRTAYVEDMVADIVKARSANILNPETMEELPEEYDDEEIIERARNASNGEKFGVLYAGNWSSYTEYPSQSEADLSLMSMFAFYSFSNEQCRRLFWSSGLGKRKKATRAYLNRTLAVVRGRQKEEELVYRSGEELAAKLMVNQWGKESGEPEVAPVATQDVAPSVVISLDNQLAKLGVSPPKPPDPLAVQTGTPDHSVAPASPVPEPQGEITWPPGLVGKIAQAIYYSAPRPVKEVAIVAALGLAAGIVGKQFNISNSGLNLYIILIARSAIGKESMHGGISRIISDMGVAYNSLIDHVDFTDYASGPALSKACAAKPCFVNVSGEWGRKLKRMTADDKDSSMQSLRTAMTNLYQKSGRDSIVGGLGYSNKDDNIASVSGIAYSMIGETTPGTFFDSLNDTVMEDGFLSRFNLIEYTGDRPPANENPLQETPVEVRSKLGAVIEKVMQLEMEGRVIDVLLTPTARQMLKDFDKVCDAEVNATNDEARRQMWNRAQLKSLRIAALLAVMDNHEIFTVHDDHAQWALDLVKRDIGIMTRRINEGDVGQGDTARERKVITALTDYLTKPLPLSLNIPEAMRKDRVVPRQYLVSRVQKSTNFKTHKMGAMAALDLTLKSLADSGYVYEVPKSTLIEKYNKHGKAYLILNIDDDKAT